MLGLRFSRLVHAAIASGALALGACSDDHGGTEGATDTTTDGTDTGEPTTGTSVDPPPPPPPPPADITPPALVSAALIDPFTLRLTFTEAIAPVDDVNPKRFRLSVARGYYGVYGGEPHVTLSDPRYYNNYYTCGPSPGCYDDPESYECYYSCYYSPSSPIEVADVFNHYADPNSVLLALTTPIRPRLCELVEQPPFPGVQHVLHLHYASGGQAQITDLAGLPLPALADGWVKSHEPYYHYSDTQPFTNFNPFLPIPCEF